MPKSPISILKRFHGPPGMIVKKKKSRILGLNGATLRARSR